MISLPKPIRWSKVAARAVFILALFMPPAIGQDASPATYRLYVDGLACPFCAYGLEKNLATIAGIDGMETDIETGTITITMADATELQRETATQAVADAGFTLRDFEQIEAAGRNRSQE